MRVRFVERDYGCILGAGAWLGGLRIGANAPTARARPRLRRFSPRSPLLLRIELKRFLVRAFASQPRRKAGRSRMARRALVRR